MRYAIQEFCFKQYIATDFATFCLIHFTSDFQLSLKSVITPNIRTIDGNKSVEVFHSQQWMG